MTRSICVDMHDLPATIKNPFDVVELVISRNKLQIPYTKEGARPQVLIMTRADLVEPAIDVYADRRFNNVFPLVH